MRRSAAWHRAVSPAGGGLHQRAVIRAESFSRRVKGKLGEAQSMWKTYSMHKVDSFVAFS
jgi:hypothetical protein